MNQKLEATLNEVKNVASKGLFHLFTANGLIFLAGFASQLFVAGFLEPTDIGRIKIMQTYLGFASILGGLGFNVSLVKLASDKISEHFRIQYFNIALFIAFASFFIFYFLMLALNNLGFLSKDIGIQEVFPYYAIFLLPLTLQAVYISYFQAIREIKKMAFFQSLIKVISVVIIILSTWKYGLQGYVWAVVCTGILGLLIFEFQIEENILKRISVWFNSSHFLDMWKLASFALAANVTGAFLTTVDVYLINYFVADRAVVGFYMFALTLVSIYQLFPSSIQQIALPFFSAKSLKFDEWYLTYKKYNLLNHILIVLVVTGGVITVSFLLPIMFNDKYNDSIIFFYLLSVGWALRSMNIIKGTALMGMGKFNLNFRSSFVSLLISFPILFYLIAVYEIEGAKYAHILIGFVSYIITSVIFRRFVNAYKASYV
ncbi:oligosaccharide flippase family protein [Cecembia lonarensis]|uniref:Polysaccharide biosynthesis protein n=1 Tax=Cecembia lonarensis (strain CCUG 58316 / KCTC 22772 / LW9) TaxID=1225176 RepID=K1L8V7_CECL9|nr:oligosaccharide flippase family protein [Cecembia lonarensis]EKB48612.1 Polysaccharide biosynthesis protein [Cecembia lonarensis LW9]